MAEQRPQRKLSDEPTCFCCFPLIGGCIALAYFNLIYTIFQTYIRFTTIWHSEISVPNYKFLFTISIIILNGFWLCVNIGMVVNLHKRKSGPLCFFIWAVIIDRALYVADGVTFILMITKVSREIMVFRSLDLALPINLLYYYYKFTKEIREWGPDPKPATTETVERTGL